MSSLAVSPSSSALFFYLVLAFGSALFLLAACCTGLAYMFAVSSVNILMPYFNFNVLSYFFGLITYGYKANTVFLCCVKHSIIWSYSFTPEVQ